MKVQFKCFANLPDKYECDYTDGTAHDIQPGETVEQFASRMNISPEDIKIIFLNGAKVDKHHILSDGDRLAFAPATGGM